MTQIISQIIQFLQQGIAAVFKFPAARLDVVLRADRRRSSSPTGRACRFGRSSLLIVVLAAIAYILYRAALVLWAAVESLFRAFVALLLAFISVLPQIVIAGLIAFAGGWIIHSVNF